MMLRKLNVGGGWNILAILVLTLWPALAMGQGETKSEPHPTPPPTEEAAEEEEDASAFTWGIDLDFVTKYIWRGTNLNDDFSIQPNLWASIYGFTASVWFQIATEGNFNDEDEQQTLEEIDLTLAYEHTFSKFTLGAGYLRYEYPGFNVDGTNEVYVSAGYDTLIAPSVSLYRDFDVESWYLEFGLGPEFSLSEKLTINPGIVAALYTFDEGDEDLNRIEPSVALNYDLGSGFSATAHAHYVIPLSDEIEDFFEDQFWGGIGFHYER